MNRCSQLDEILQDARNPENFKVIGQRWRSQDQICGLSVTRYRLWCDNSDLLQQSAFRDNKFLAINSRLFCTSVQWQAQNGVIQNNNWTN